MAEPNLQKSVAVEEKATQQDSSIPPRIDQASAESWKNTWTDMLAGGPQRWKDGEKTLNYEIAYTYLCKHGALDDKKSVFVPLAGDCKFVSYVASKGCAVVVNEQVAIAVQSMKDACTGVEFESKSLSQSESCDDDELWSDRSGKLSIWQTSFFAIPAKSFNVDCVYDKDAFGAIQPKDRENYVKQIKTFLNKGGYVLLEVKNRNDGFEGGGPPFHFDKNTVEQYFTGFTIVEYIPSFYPLSNPSWKQQAFLLKFD